MTLRSHAHRYVDMEPHVDTLLRLASKAPVIVELGVRGGVSTWAFLDGMPEDGRLVSVDIDPTVPDQVPSRVSGDPRWALIIGDDRIDTYQRQLPEADLVFIDTSHEYHHTAAELLLAQRLKADHIVLHDWCLTDVQDAVLGFVHRTRYEIEQVEDSRWGLVVLRR